MSKAKRKSSNSSEHFIPARSLENMGSRKLLAADRATVERAFGKETNEALALTSERWADLGAAIWFARFYAKQRAEGKFERSAKRLLRDVQTAASKLRDVMLRIVPDGQCEQSAEATRVWDALGCEIELSSDTAFDRASKTAIGALPQILRNLLERVKKAQEFLAPETKLGAPNKFLVHETLILCLAEVYREATRKVAAAGYSKDSGLHTGPFPRIASQVICGLEGIPSISEKKLGSLIHRTVGTQSSGNKSKSSF
jgi:hypothetical protein